MTQHDHELDIHDDDKPVGRLLSRREMMKMLGGSGIAIVAGLSLPKLGLAQEATESATALPSCVVRPELTEGPYFVDEVMERFDIRTEPTDETLKAGLPLLLKYRVTDVSNASCSPLEGAQIDVWHCDADGDYSGVNDPGFDTEGEMWLRGYQITDEYGEAQFLTIVPGWYSGRAVHIHFKIRTETADGESYEYTSQFFFDPELIEELYQEEPYAGKGSPDTPNETDNIYQGSDGQLTLNLIALTDEEMEIINADDTVAEAISAGYSATFDVGLDLTDMTVGASDSAGGGGGQGGRGGNGPGGGNPPGN